MDTKIKILNIFTLIFFFLLGYISNILVLNWANIDIYEYISKLERSTTVEELPVVEQDIQECEPCICTEEVLDTCPIQVDISGAVESPGVYCFENGSSVIDAVKRANGFKQEAGYKYISMRINLATVMIDNSKIYIPYEQDYDCKLLSFTLPKEIIDISTPDVLPDESENETQRECISINTATNEELDSLDGVGPSTALKIIEGRPYTNIDELLNVSGIGEATLNKFRDLICL